MKIKKAMNQIKYSEKRKFEELKRIRRVDGYFIKTNLEKLGIETIGEFFDFIKRNKNLGKTPKQIIRNYNKELEQW